MKKLIVIFSLFFTIPAIAQNEDQLTLWEDEVPVHIAKSFADNFPGSLNVDWEVIDGNYQAEFIAGKTQRYAMFAPDGTMLVETEEIPLKLFPQRVGEAVGEFVGQDFELRGARRVNHFSGSNYFAVDVTVNGMDQQVFVDPNGGVLSGGAFTYEE